MEKSKRIIFLLAFGFSAGLILIGIFFMPSGTLDPGPTTDRRQPSAPTVSARVTSVEPLEGQKGVSAAPDIRVVFTLPVNKDELSVESSPNAFFKLVDYKKLSYEAIFRPSEPLRPSKKYALVVKVGEQPLFRWEFSTKSFSSKDKKLAQKINKVKAQIPKKTNNYIISYDAATDDFVVYVQKGNFSTERRKAANWFKSFGISNLSVINISYIPRAGARGDF